MPKFLAKAERVALEHYPIACTNRWKDHVQVISKALQEAYVEGYLARAKENKEVSEPVVKAVEDHVSMWRLFEATYRAD